MLKHSTSPQLILVYLLMVIGLGMGGCKAKKQAKAAAAAKQDLIAQTIEDLTALLDDEDMPIDEKEQELTRIKNLYLEDDEVNRLIKLVEEQIAEARRRMAEKEDIIDNKNESDRYADEEARKQQLNNYLEQIASSGNKRQANRTIIDALSMFASRNTPVLIVFYSAPNVRDYDRPTTIEDYLNYVKDQGKNPNTIDKLSFNSGGKITEVELLKN